MHKPSKLNALVSLITLFVVILTNVQPVASMTEKKPDTPKRVVDVVLLELQEGVTLEEDENGSPGRKFKTNSKELEQALSATGVQGVKPLFSMGKEKRNLDAKSLERIYRVKIKPNADLDEALAALASVADVRFAEPDYYVETEDDPTPTGTVAPSLPSTNDPRYLEQWALPAIGAADAWADVPADAPQIIIAVIDSGVCVSHPDLSGRILSGWDFIENDNLPQDDFGHGCAVTGVIAANINNEIGIAGVTPNAQILPLRVLNETGTGSYSDVASAIVYAVDHGAQIINLSLGGSNTSTTLQNAVQYALSNRVTVVSSAGNNGTQNVLYPAAYEGVVAVGSVDSDLKRSSFSNYGAQVDIWAPGRDILTTYLNDDFKVMSGTSFAAPYVSGAKALQMARGKDLTLDEGVLWLGETITETPTPSTPTPPVTEIPTISPTPISGIDPATAGNGSLYRAQVRLKQPRDLARLEEWNVKVLDFAIGSAVVQVTPEQLSKLARLGFEPSQADSVEYMLAIQSAMSGKVLSLSDVKSSASDMLSLSSVDSDADGLTDTEEAWWCTNPADTNSDFAGLPTTGDPNDGDEVEAVLKGITSYGPPFEMWPNFKPYNTNGTCLDGDFDGVPDNAELYIIGTSPQRESSDLDKFDDGQELFGVTFCPGQSGPCGYGILPRAEDMAFVTANLPAWVKVPGNSPFVAAFPEPQVEVESSSIMMTQKTVITNTKGTTIGTEKTYGTSTTKGTSSSSSDTITWNNWQEVSTTRPNVNSSMAPLVAKALEFLGTTVLMCGVEQYVNGENICVKFVKKSTNDIGQAVTTYLDYKRQEGEDFARQVQSGDIDLLDALFFTGNCYPDFNPLSLSAQSEQLSCTGAANGVHAPTSEESIDINLADIQNQNSIHGRNDFSITTSNDQSTVQVQNNYRAVYPAILPVPSTTVTRGEAHGGAYTTTHTEYEEQTISESSTNQYSDNWTTATAVDSSHAADLRFTYNIVNNGTEYAREVTSLTFNIYIGDNPNPAYTYVAVGSTGQIAKIENLFPGDSLTYTSTPIALTLDEMRAIDEGAPVRVVMEDISFGQDQVFYLDALNGSVTLAMEDGYDDLDQTLDTYLIPVWSPTDTVQDVVKRYFPTIEDSDGNLLAVFTPESKSSIPERCEQDVNIAPASNTEVFCKHALTGTSWWNIYLSEGLNYSDAFKDTVAAPNTSVLVRIVSDRDLDGYNDRNEMVLGTDPDDAASHPSPNLIAGYTTSCTGDDCTVRMVFQNLGNYDAYGVEAVMYSPDGLATITNNTIGGSGRVSAGERVVVGPSDTFQYTKTAGSVEPVIMVSYNDPQGNHRFILPAGNYPSGAKINTLDDVITALDGKMLLDPGVDISSTSSNQAGFVINSPHPVSITDGKLFVEYIDGNGNVLHEDVVSQTFDSGPTVVQQTINLGTYPPETTILLAFFTDSQGNIIDSSARPLASFGADPAPEANITVENWQVGSQSVVSVPNPWNLGAFETGTTLHAKLYLTNTGLGDLRYSLSGLGGGWSIAGNPAGTLGPTQQTVFELAFDSAGLSPQTVNRTLYLRTNDPANGTVTINLQATITAQSGTASAYQVNQLNPWNQYVYVAGPRAQNEIVTFSPSFLDNPARMYPINLYTEDGQTLKGIGEYGVDFSGQTASFGVFGDGSDNNFIGGDPNTIKTALSSNSNVGQPTINVTDSTNFVVGKEILIIQVQGTNAGKYEFGTIASKGTGFITLLQNLVNTYYQDGTSKAQVLWVPHYNVVSGSITTGEWNGLTGGIVVFRAISMNNTSIDVTGKGFKGGYGNDSAGWAGGYSCNNSYATQGASPAGNGGCSYLANNGGGGAGHDTSGSGGGGGYGTAGGIGGGAQYGYPGNQYGNADLSSLFLGSGGGGGSWGTNPYGGGRRSIQGSDFSGQGAGAVFVSARTISGLNINANGNSGANSNGTYGGYAGGGGSGGSVKIIGDTISLGTVQALGGAGGDGTYVDGGNGGVGRVRVEYNTVNGTTNPTYSPLHVNYYNLTGTSPTILYMPAAVSGGSNIRYLLQYGQRSLTNTGGNQLFSVTLPNHQYSSVTLSALMERVAGSAGTFNFCLDFGNDGVCDWTSSSQTFSGPVQLNSGNLKDALNAYIVAQNSSAETLAIPIRVNLDTPADIFLFNLSSSTDADVELIPHNFTVTPPNGNPPSNIPEGSQVTLSASVTNNGSYKAENFTVAFYNGNPSDGGMLIGSTFVPSLAAGATSSAQTVTWNTAGLLGEKTVYVKVDPFNAVGESNETNNTASAATIIKKKADLLITSLIIPDIRQNETGVASVTVQNDGQADVTGAVIKLYKDAVILGSTTINVAQNSSAVGQINFTLPAAGIHALLAKADPDDTVLEADETNNTFNGNAKVGWDALVIDAGGAGDTAYSSNAGYGWLFEGAPVTTCGTGIQQSYRQAGSAETLQYRFDHLIPGRRYHLDLTFAACSGDRYLDLFVDGAQVEEQRAALLSSASASAVHIDSAPHTVSLLLDPASYAQDGSIILSISRNSGFGGPLVNIIDLQEVKYCYLDSGPTEVAWNAENQCGYDSTWTSDGFNGWGDLPYETMRFGNGSVKYKFSGLTPSTSYNLRMTYYEKDNAARAQRVTFDGASPSAAFTVSSTPASLIIPVPVSSYADGSVIAAIERPAGGEAVISEIALEENTRRYPSPDSSGTTPNTPTPPPDSTPQVTLSAFTAAWVGSHVKVDWATTTEINNNQFELYRSTTVSGPWTLIRQQSSQSPCGTFTSTTPAAYTYTDTSVVLGTTYYYKLNFSGEGCGIGSLNYAETAQAKPTPRTLIVKSISTHDGWVLESTETSKKGGTRNNTSTTFNLGDDAARKQYLGILSFKTNLPAGAVISKVTLKVKKAGTAVGGGDPVKIFGGFIAQIKKGTFGTSALAIGDFQSRANGSTAAVKPVLTSGWYSIDMSGVKVHVNPVGLTQIRLKFKLDDNNNSIANYLKLYSGNAGSANAPQLIIEYYVP